MFSPNFFESKAVSQILKTFTIVETKNFHYISDLIIDFYRLLIDMKDMF